MTEDAVLPSGILWSFDLAARVIVITGGAGLLGRRHADAIAEAGGIPVLADLDIEAAERHAGILEARTGSRASAVRLDVTSKDSATLALRDILDRYGRVDGLINNAARNPKVEDGSIGASRFENLDLATWNRDLEVGLTGAFIVTQVFGTHLAEQGVGTIVNIASDLSVISPDQRLYRKAGIPEHEQPVKPVTYSVIKAGLVMMTKYLATYWASSGVRVNALSPGGVYAGQPGEFVERLASRIPMARMARQDEYKAAVVFLCSDASSYMTGHNLVIDGGRTCW